MINQWFLRDKNKNCYGIYSSVPEVQIRIQGDSGAEDFIVSINDVNYRLKDASEFTITPIMDGRGDQLGIIRLFEDIIIEKNPISISIREKGSKRILYEDRICILDNLYYEFDQEFYYDDTRAELKKFEIDGVDYIGSSDSGIVNLKISDCYRTEIMINQETYQMIIEVPVLKWSIGSITSASNRFEDIWWEDIQDQKVYIKFPPKLYSALYVSTGSSFEKIEGNRIADEYKYSIEHLFLMKNQSFLTLGFLINGQQYKVANIHFKPFLQKLTVSYGDKHDLWPGLYSQWGYIGRGELHIDIVRKLTAEVVNHYVIKDGNQLIDKDLNLNYDRYDMHIYRLVEDDFLGTGTEKKSLCCESFVVGDEILVMTRGRLLKGRWGIDPDKKYELANFYVKNIRMSRKNMNYEYEANCFYYIHDKYSGAEREWFFSAYNPFFLRKVLVESKKFIFEIVDRDEDGLVYDSEKKYINPKTQDNDKQNYSRYKVIDAIEFELV